MGLPVFLLALSLLEGLLNDGQLLPTSSLDWTHLIKHQFYAVGSVSGRSWLRVSAVSPVMFGAGQSIVV